MATVELSPNSLTVHISGLDRILAFKSTITVPLEHVVSVDRDLAEASVVYHGLKLPGTGIPGVITAGSFHRKGEWSFWDVHDPTAAIIIRLRDEHYRKLVIGVEDPQATARWISDALATGPEPRADGDGSIRRQ